MLPRLPLDALPNPALNFPDAIRLESPLFIAHVHLPCVDGDDMDALAQRIGNVAQDGGSDLEFGSRLSDRQIHPCGGVGPCGRAQSMAGVRGVSSGDGSILFSPECPRLDSPFGRLVMALSRQQSLEISWHHWQTTPLANALSGDRKGSS